MPEHSRTPGDFFIGYQDRAPDAVARTMRRLVPALGMLLVAAGILLARSQEFDPSLFEFGTIVPFEGAFMANPVPHLVTDDGSVLLLVGQGKHGARPEAPDGGRIRLEGTLILRGATVMVEVVPESVHLLDSERTEPGTTQAVEATVTGEIVGSKCYLGVMNPGRGPVHRACARHCILGGVPAMLVEHPASSAGGLVLTGLAPREMARFASVPVRISGTLRTRDGLRWLEVASIVRLGERGS